jgi:hypothetical protein
MMLTTFFGTTIMNNILKYIAGIVLYIYTGALQAALINLENGIIYDDVLDISWLQDTKSAETLDSNVSASMSWNDANNFAENYVLNSYDNWRLPTLTLLQSCYNYDGSCDSGYNNVNGELSHLFYSSLSNPGLCQGVIGNICVRNSDWRNLNTHEFTNWTKSSVEVFWYSTLDTNNSNAAWTFNTYFGRQSVASINSTAIAWLVHDGKIDGKQKVPTVSSFASVQINEPSLLILLGLICLLFTRNQLNTTASL